MDGIVINAAKDEFKNKIVGFNINKIYQPQPDSIILIANKYKLLISANPSAPRIHFSSQTQDNPKNAPMFCMVLRKYIQNSRIKNIVQPDFERILNFELESVNEFGDARQFKLIVEIMGKHSNIILTDENEMIIDAIKHVPIFKSSVRQILPHLKYKMPPNPNKINPLEITEQEFKSLPHDESIYKFLNGISPTIAKEICFRSQNQNLYQNFFAIQQNIINSRYELEIIYDENDKPIILSAVDLKMYTGKKIKFADASEAIETFFSHKAKQNTLHQKSADIQKIISNNISRCQKKIQLQLQSLRDTANKNEYKLFGELIMANIYKIKSGSDFFLAQNYYDNDKPVEIKLDKNLSASENAQKYFRKYNRLKRTEIAVSEQLKLNNDELEYLKSVMQNLRLCESESDIDEIRDELYQQKIIHKHKNKQIKKPSYLKFVSSDGLNIFVGKNNLQNDFLTLKFAHANDLWLHTKNIPGSHVIIRTENKSVTSQTLFEAANLCALHSKACNSSNVAVDYTQKKFVKKPSGAKPGMVIYENYKTIYVTPDKSLMDNLKRMDEN